MTAASVTVHPVSEFDHADILAVLMKSSNISGGPAGRILSQPDI